MEEKNDEELKKVKEKDVIGAAAVKVIKQYRQELCNEIKDYDLEIKHTNDGYFQIYKVYNAYQTKKGKWMLKWLGIKKDTLTPVCFINDRITKSAFNETWLEIDLYDMSHILTILNKEMGIAAEQLNAKTRIIFLQMQENKLILEEYIKEAQ